MFDQEDRLINDLSPLAFSQPQRQMLWRPGGPDRQLMPRTATIIFTFAPGPHAIFVRHNLLPYLPLT
jgi:hypothetical protein